MEKLYLVRETQFGFTVEGPNGHKWQATTEDGWTRTVAFAKALERAFLEGQKSITQDMDIMMLLALIETLGEESQGLSPEDLKARYRLVMSRAQKLSDKFDAARQANVGEDIYRPKKPNGNTTPVT